MPRAINHRHRRCDSDGYTAAGLQCPEDQAVLIRPVRVTTGQRQSSQSCRRCGVLSIEDPDIVVQQTGGDEAVI